MRATPKRHSVLTEPYLQVQFDKLSSMVENYLPRKHGTELDKSKLAAILETHQALLMVDSCIFGIIDYATTSYLFLSDNVTYLDVEKEKALEFGLPYLIRAFHPDEVPVMLEKIIPAALGFICDTGDAVHPRNARAAFTTRLRLKTGEYKWFVHQMSTICSDENNIPLLALKSMFEIEGIKSGKHMNLVLSRRNETGSYHVAEELVFPLPVNDNTLSSREMQVLRLISEGKASKEIAHILNISINTVNNHRKNILRKKNSASMSAVIFNASEFLYST